MCHGPLGSHTLLVIGVQNWSLRTWPPEGIRTIGSMGCDAHYGGPEVRWPRRDSGPPNHTSLERERASLIHFHSIVHSKRVVRGSRSIACKSVYSMNTPLNVKLVRVQSQDVYESQHTH